MVPKRATPAGPQQVGKTPAGSSASAPWTDIPDSAPPPSFSIKSALDDIDFPPLGTRPELCSVDFCPTLRMPTSVRRHRRRGLMSALERSDRRSQGFESLTILEAALRGDPGRVSVVQRLRSRYESLCDHSGVEFALRDLKSVSGDARSHWILQGGSDSDAQISFLGRSLPPGTSVQVDTALRQHHADLSSGFQTDLNVLKAARSFGRVWARRNLSTAAVMSPPDLPTLSSCTEYTVRQGGLRGFVTSLGVHATASRLSEDLLLKAELPLQDIESLVADMSLIYHGIDLAKAGDFISTALGITERGGKVRIITKSPAGLHLLGHVVRKRLLGGLRKDPASASPLSGVEDSDVIGRLVGASSETLVSSDLTRASDLLPLDLIGAIVDGIISSGRLTRIEQDALRLCIAPQHILYPPHLGLSPVVSARGILMGLPCTWPLLSLVHLFWWNEATKVAAREKRVRHGEAFALNRYAICGDDAVFAGWTRTADLYDRLLKLSGASTSVGKHFRSSIGRFVFLERLYALNYRDGFVRGGHRSSAIPLRGFVRPEVPLQFSGEGSRVSCSLTVKLLFALDSIWATHPGAEKRLGLMSTIAFPWLRRAAKRIGLTNGLPMKYGGSGIPNELGSCGNTAKILAARSILGQRVGIELPGLVRGILSSAWQLATDLVEFDLPDYFADGTFVKTDCPRTAPPCELPRRPYVYAGTLEAMTKAVKADRYRSIVMSMEDATTQRPLREVDLAIAVSRWRNLLPPLGGGSPDEIIANGVPPVHVWVERTLAPDGQTLLYPRWVGETRSSEARHRAKLCGAIRLAPQAG